ncbi:hypothetical protein JCM11641_005834 [Rhodosporidiobolus odoratus]
MPKAKSTPAPAFVPDNKNARHLSCEGCRKRKMKCSRTAPCVACELRGCECVWVDCKPSQGVTKISVEENEREIIRLTKIIAQLQSLIIERDGRPYYPPPVAPPTPPSHLDNLPWGVPHTSPLPNPEFGWEQPEPTFFGTEDERFLPQAASSFAAAGGEPHFYGVPQAAGRPAGAPYSGSPAPAHARLDPVTGDYIVETPTSAYPHLARYHAFPYPPQAHAVRLNGTPGNADFASPVTPAFGGHVRAATWAGAIPQYHPSYSPPPSAPHSQTVSEQQAQQSLPPQAQHLHSADATYASPVASPHGSGSVVRGSISSVAPGSPLSSYSADATADMFSQLPKLDTSVSLHLPATVSALLNLDTARNFVDESVETPSSSVLAVKEPMEKDKAEEVDGWKDLLVEAAA